ncbi:MAG: metalloregulator ArsR/SmtB family transcription factor [Pseudomonadota bacterium]
MSNASNLDAAFAALANRTRRAILARLSKGEATVNELAEPFQMSLPAVSKHIRVLEEAGFVTRGKNAQFRPCRLDTKPLEAITDWTAQYRHIWASRFDSMADALSLEEELEND